MTACCNMCAFCIYFIKVLWFLKVCANHNRLLLVLQAVEKVKNIAVSIKKDDPK